MRRFDHLTARLPLVAAVAVLAVGGAVEAAVDSTAGLAVTGALTVFGIAGVALFVRDLDYRPLVRLCRRFWIAALAVLVPYGLAIAPESPAAAAMGALLDAPAVIALLGGLVWAFQMGAVAATVFVGIAVLRRELPIESPEERILDDDLGL